MVVFSFFRRKVVNCTLNLNLNFDNDAFLFTFIASQYSMKSPLNLMSHFKIENPLKNGESDLDMKEITVTIYL